MNAPAVAFNEASSLGNGELPMITALKRKHTLLEATTAFHRSQIYLPSKDEYIHGFKTKPEDGFCDYDGRDVEPIINPKELYNLPPEAWLTVNHYNALIFNTRNMLIADIDFGDERLNRFAGARDCDDVIHNLNHLHVLDEQQGDFADLRFADQSYHVYRTHSGCRVICTSICVPWESRRWEARCFMRFLRSDPQYIDLCGKQNCYRARLTAKPWRTNGDLCHVCEYEASVGIGPVAEAIGEQLALHDELTLAEQEWSHLA